jgi:hypothetical protein
VIVHKSKRSRAGQGAASGLSPLVAAYREGLGLAAVAVVCGPNGTRVTAIERDAGALGAGETVNMRWWCRRMAEAERVATAATRHLLRRESRGKIGPQDECGFAPADASAPGRLICESIVSAAKRLNVVLHSDDEISSQAMTVIARVDQEIERLRQSGELKSVNRSYRTYRIEASARGEKIVRYSEWMRKYRENLVRELAAMLRYC